nr:transposase [Sphingomonas formosensis]
MSDLYWLTDEQMARLEPYFPKSHGRPRVDDRRVLSGIIFVIATGCAGGTRRKIMGRTRRCTTAGSAWARWVSSPG